MYTIVNDFSNCPSSLVLNSFLMPELQLKVVSSSEVTPFHLTSIASVSARDDRGGKESRGQRNQDTAEMGEHCVPPVRPHFSTTYGMLPRVGGAAIGLA